MRAVFSGAAGEEAAATEGAGATTALAATAQRTFEAKTRRAIEIALSKYAPVVVPDSLFSKKKLLPSCAACGRASLQQPGEHGGHGGGHDHAHEQAAHARGEEENTQPPPLPSPSDAHARMASHHGKPNGTLFPGGGGGGGGGSSSSKSNRSYVRVAGFKMPKASSAPVLPPHHGITSSGGVRVQEISLGGRAAQPTASVQRVLPRRPLSALVRADDASASRAAFDKGNRQRNWSSGARPSSASAARARQDAAAGGAPVGQLRPSMQEGVSAVAAAAHEGSGRGEAAAPRLLSATTQ